MKINYTKHLEHRLTLRKMEYSLPRKIFELSDERYFDEETKYFIATMEVELYNKTRGVMIAYVVEGSTVKILTIHPVEEGQKENRVKSGRWRKL